MLWMSASRVAQASAIPRVRTTGQGFSKALETRSIEPAGNSNPDS